MTSIVRMAPNGDMNVRGEIVQTPSELWGTGGRNLLSGSVNMQDYRFGTDRGGSREYVKEGEVTYIRFSTTGNAYIWLTGTLDRKIGEVYTISFDIRTQTTGRLYFYPSEKYTGWALPNTGGDWQRISFTYNQTGGDVSGPTAMLFGIHSLADVSQPVDIRLPKLERGPSNFKWSPSPEDIGVDWLPGWIQDFSSPIAYSPSGDMAINRQLIEIPDVLRGTGGRNLFRHSKINDLALAGTGVTGDIVKSPAYRGYTIPVRPGETYSFSRKELINDRFRCVFTSQEPASGVQYFGGTGSIYDAAPKIENIVVPEGAHYMFLYLSRESSPVPDIKIEKGSATDWSPAPEDIGIDWLPDNLHQFSTPIAIHDDWVLLNGDLSECKDALFFNGTDNHINMGNDPLFNLENEMTFTCWSNTSKDGYYIYRGVGTGIRHYGFCNYPSNRSITLYYTYSGQSYTQAVWSGSQLTDGGWHHIALVVKDRSAELYIDGVSQGTKTISPMTSPGNADMLIGARPGGFRVTGSMKNITLWNRALDAAGIASIHSSGVHGNEVGLIGYWKLNEGEGNVAYDSSPHRKNGEINGTANWISTLDA